MQALIDWTSLIRPDLCITVNVATVTDVAMNRWSLQENPSGKRQLQSNESLVHSQEGVRIDDGEKKVKRQKNTCQIKCLTELA